MEKHDRKRDCAVRLRPATLEDEPFLRHLFASTRADELSLMACDESQKEMFITMQFNGQKQQYAMTYPQADHSVILLNEGRVGRMIVASSEAAISLVDIALLPKYRNAGIGSRLIQDLLKEAATARKAVRLSVFASSPAIRLYERLGFSRAGGDAAYLEMKWVPSVFDPAAQG
jgi:ribosomal protein S18 acetylase RimI-like enzyme